MNDENVDRCVRQHDELDQHESERVKCDLYSHAGGATIDKGCAASYSLMNNVCDTEGAFAQITEC